MKEEKQITRDRLISHFGFEDAWAFKDGPHKEDNLLVLDLEMDRKLYIYNVGTTEEKISIIEEGPCEIVTLHKHEYYGYMTEDRLTDLLKGLNHTTK